MDEACKYFAAQVANVDRMEKLKSTTGFQNSKVYKHFTSQLSDAKRMDKKKKLNAHLDLLDKQHKFIILRSLTGYDYKSQMHRSNMLEKSHQIYENTVLQQEKRLPNNISKRSLPLQIKG